METIIHQNLSAKSTKLSETVIIFFYLLSMKCSTLLISRTKVRIGVGIGISQLIIACCLACSAALWTVDLIQLWRYNSFLNENDPMGSGKPQNIILKCLLNTITSPRNVRFWILLDYDVVQLRYFRIYWNFYDCYMDFARTISPAAQVRFQISIVSL